MKPKDKLTPEQVAKLQAEITDKKKKKLVKK